MRNIFRNLEKAYSFFYLNFKSGFFKNNKILGNLPTLRNSKIIFKGKNNILYCDKNVRIKDCKLIFKGSNSIIFLGSGKHSYDVDIYNNSIFHVGRENFFHPDIIKTKIILSEEKNVFIGDNNIISLQCFIRTADPHLIFDSNTKERINFSKSIYIGDHVWLGQGCTILKGCHIHSGSIIGSQSVLSNKKIYSNTVWGGNPAKQIKKDIFWESPSVHTWTQKDTQQHLKSQTNNYIFKLNENTISFDEIEKSLVNLKSTKDKLDYLKNLSQNKNRFSKEDVIRNKI